MHQEDMEQLAFLYLCGARDRRLLSGSEKMTFSDFDRLVYITAFLGLIHYNLKMWNQFSVQFQSQLEAQAWSCEQRMVPLHPSEYEPDLCQREQWLEEFCSSAPDQETEDYLRELVCTLN